MLSPRIHSAFQAGVDRLRDRPDVEVLADSSGNTRESDGQTVVFRSNSRTVLECPEVLEEVFGSATLLVVCDDLDQLVLILNRLEGQLTMSIQATSYDSRLAQVILPIMEAKAGRLLYNDWPTAVQVREEMVHGGPFPVTSDSRFTAVGIRSIDRFLRPVCYQNFPSELLVSAGLMESEADI
jgi:2,5-dioxopentanoate dehydrogenase